MYDIDEAKSMLFSSLKIYGIFIKQNGKSYKLENIYKYVLVFLRIFLRFLQIKVLECSSDMLLSHDNVTIQ